MPFWFRWGTFQLHMCFPFTSLQAYPVNYVYAPSRSWFAEMRFSFFQDFLIRLRSFSTVLRHVLLERPIRHVGIVDFPAWSSQQWSSHPLFRMVNEIVSCTYYTMSQKLPSILRFESSCGRVMWGVWMSKEFSGHRTIAL